ncbi:MAG: site-2 protease family protein [Sedimentisphaerales bacterium]|nr:site-2 protease family protein [Sedimentisphaerales bacterium]
MQNINIEYVIKVLIVVLPSLAVHELAHAFTAYKFGDTTAKDMGRLTLNPIAHIDFFGTIILPILVGFGYAKPVPVNFSVLTRLQIVLVAIAGPASNLCLATILALSYHILPVANIPILKYFLLLGVQLNIVFAVFNLIPIPPLDGSRLIYASLRTPKAMRFYSHFSQVSMILLVGLMYLSFSGRFNFFGMVIDPVIGFFFRLFQLSS